jgi:SMI1 / KNR4 family (SUKH-1)
MCRMSEGLQTYEMEIKVQITEKLKQLGYRPLFDDDVNFINFDKQFYNKGIILPQEYLDFLSQNPITGVFDNSIVFRSDVPSPWAVDGFEDLSVLYGNCKLLTNDILEVQMTFKDRIPDRFFLIGESEGGNQIGISLAPNRYGTVYFWDHEADETGIYSIADSFSDLISRLVVADYPTELYTEDEPKLISMTTTGELEARIAALVAKKK